MKLKKHGALNRPRLPSSGDSEFIAGFMQNIVEYLPARIYWKDLDGKYLGCNAAHTKMLGFSSSSEIVGKTDFELEWSKDIAMQLKKNEFEVIITGNAKYYPEKLNINNKEIRVLSKKSPLVNAKGKVIGVIAVCFDFSEEDNSYDKSLYLFKDKKNDELTLQNIIDNFPGHVYWKNHDGRYLGSNFEHAQNLGLNSVADMLGKTDFELPWPKGSAEQFRENDLEVMKTDCKKSVEEYSQMRGKKVTVLSRKSALKNDLNEIIGVIGVSLDITDTKEKERLALENEANKLKALKFQNKANKAKTLQLKATLKEHKKFQQMIGQMIHDIQSPLSSLQTIVKTTVGIPESERIGLRNAAMTIGDTTNNMLRKYKRKDDKSEEFRQPVLASAILLQVLSDKRYEYKNLNKKLYEDLPIEFDCDFKVDANFIFVNIEPVEFRRMISNVLNNAVDALKNKPETPRKVIIVLEGSSEWVMVSIEDNALGMPRDVLEKIQKGIIVTKGKKGNHHGFGLTHVRETLSKNMGKFSISSNIDGTIVTLFFPRITAPNWICDEIKIIKGDLVLILDDDPSIHTAWETKLAPIIAKNPSIKTKHFSEGAALLDFVRNLTLNAKQNICLLSDYELLGQNLTGVEVIKQSGIKRTTLVTSHHANSQIRKNMVKMNAKILPKDLVNVVNIIVDKKIIPGSKHVDMVWVDDDKSYVDYLLKKYYSHLQVDTYTDPFEFLKDVTQYPLDTKILLDNYYTSATDNAIHLNGTMVAAKLYAMGYTNLCLLSGLSEQQLGIPEYLKFIRKNDQEALARLDKF